MLAVTNNRLILPARFLFISLFFSLANTLNPFHFVGHEFLLNYHLAEISFDRRHL